jgi:hypothetical protein
LGILFENSVEKKLQQITPRKESEEIIIRRIVRRLDRHFSAVEKQLAESAPIDNHFVHPENETTQIRLGSSAPPPPPPAPTPVAPPPPAPTPVAPPPPAPTPVAPPPPAPTPVAPPPPAPTPVAPPPPTAFKPQSNIFVPKSEASPKTRPQPATKPKPNQQQPAPSVFSPENDADSRVDKIFSSTPTKPTDRSAMKAFLFVLALGIVVAAMFLFLDYF